MAYLKEFSGKTLLIIENDYIKDFSSRQIKYKISGNNVQDFYGRTLFKLENDSVKDFSGRILLKIDYNSVKDFSYRTIAKFDNNYIKEFSGTIIYKIDGFLSRREMMALLAILFAC